MARTTPHAAAGTPLEASRRGLTPERVVLWVGLLGGLLLTFVTPPFQVPDEPAHFFHVYQIATGATLERGPGGAPGFEMPASLESLATLCLADVRFRTKVKLPPGTLGEAWRMPLAPERRGFVPAGDVSPYTPVPYVPAAAAVALGRLAAARPLILLYLARLANLAASLALVCLAVRRTPILPWLFVLLGLTPMAMFERASASADALTDAFALALVSLVLSLAVGGYRDPSHEGADDEPRTWRRRALGVLCVVVLLAGAKAVYFLLDGMVLLVPWSRLRSRRRALALWGGGAAAIVVGLGVTWVVARDYFSLGKLREGVVPAAQMRGVLGAPGHFLVLAAGDYFHHAKLYVVSFVGNLGWMDTPLPSVVVLLWLALLLLAAVTGGDPDVRFAGWQRGLAAAVAAASLLALSLSQYVSWTPLGAAYIEGLQGRYFLPLAPLLAVLLHNRAWAPAPATSAEPARWPWPACVYAGAAAAATVATLVRIWFRYH
jgi:hypothetical protein